MDCTGDMLKRMEALERVIRAQNDILIDLSQRVAEQALQGGVYDERTWCSLELL